MVAAAPLADSWAAHLREGEHLLWMGRPSTALKFRAPRTQIIFYFAGLAAFVFFFGWLWLETGEDQLGNGAIAVGVCLLALPFLVVSFADWFKRRTTFYSLTTQRAAIAHGSLLRKLSFFPIDAASPLVWHKTTPPTIYFAHKVVAGAQRHSRQTLRYGFEYLPDARQVYEMLKQVQNRDTITQGDIDEAAL